MYYCKYNSKTISYHEKKSPEQNFFDFLDLKGISKHDILNLAMKTNFMKRKPRKIDPYKFLSIVCTMAVLDTPSFNSIAARYSADYGTLATKQAISKKITTECLEFFMAILALIIKIKVSKSKPITPVMMKGYKRVLVQDSTIIKLPLRLFDSFSGVKNADTSVCNGRIQGVFDLVSGTFIEFSIDPYSKNDLIAAPLLEIRKDDLVLRDRGYLINDEVQRHLDAKADCIYRCKTHTILIDIQTGLEINLCKLLKKKKHIDIEVRLNNKQRTKARLIGMPVSEEIANRRRANAKKNSKGHNPSKEVLHLMSWTLFITTIPAEKAAPNKILELYSLRWRIEIIFKAWKSHAAFAKIHNVSEHQLRILLTARFIMIVIFTHCVFNPFLSIIRRRYNREVSLLKLFSYLTKNMNQLIILLQYASNEKKCASEKMLLKFCTYDKRVRANYNLCLMNNSFS